MFPLEDVLLGDRSNLDVGEPMDTSIHFFPSILEDVKEAPTITFLLIASDHRVLALGDGRETLSFQA
jgi:hypothetical protein